MATSKRVPPAELLARERQAMTLRQAGVTYDRIAEQLGYTNKSAARKAVFRGIERSMQESADELRLVEADRLDRLQTGHWNKAVNGDVASSRIVLGIMERRAKLFALDAPAASDDNSAPFIIQINPAILPPPMSDGDDDADAAP